MCKGKKSVNLQNIRFDLITMCDEFASRKKKIEKLSFHPQVEL